jgi:ankyrin repeat protein
MLVATARGMVLDWLRGRTESALFRAASRGDVRRIEELVVAGVSVDARSRGWLTPLMTAASAGQAEAVTLLLSLGADPCALSIAGMNALMLGARSPGVVRALLLAGVPADSADAFGSTPLMIAAMLGGLESVRLLAFADADVNARVHTSAPMEGLPGNALGNTPFSSAAAGGNVRVMAFLEQLGADVDVRLHDGFTPLLVAAANLEEGTVRALVALGADRTARVESGPLAGCDAAQLANAAGKAMLPRAHGNALDVAMIAARMLNVQYAVADAGDTEGTPPSTARAA